MWSMPCTDLKPGQLEKQKESEGRQNVVQQKDVRIKWVDRTKNKEKIKEKRTIWENLKRREQIKGKTLSH